MKFEQKKMIHEKYQNSYKNHFTKKYVLIDCSRSKSK